METFSPVRLAAPAVEVLDQTMLPQREVWLRIEPVAAMCEAIAALRVRGAPLLGICGAAGMALAGEERGTTDGALRAAAEEISATRPTAVELSWGARVAMHAALAEADEPGARRARLWQFAGDHMERRKREDLALARHGAALLPEGAAVLTHCNTGALATGGIGTALGVIRVAHAEGRLAHCYATETRPLLQGARLTAWELARAGIPASLLPDTAAAALIASGRIQAVITGADRIAMNGDSANKIGTYGLAVVAARHGVPFYIAAPWTTIDAGCDSGREIPIEFRPDEEVGGFGGQRWSPEGLGAYNPAFDVTPGELVSAIITEAGVARAPYGSSLAELVAQP
ncbi:MAG: S-methyl-5-thioribose-1-phosphate isomerase [Chloroflexi bacterium]|nr:S-methyl-5-thioribose-1-phosphate isomerase [Chloroflexota bacterium]